MIRLEAVSVAAAERRGRGRPEAGRLLLEDVHLAAGARELVVVHGPGGAGKSVLLAVAAARRAPQQGTVWISSRSLADLQRSSLPLVHRDIAYLPSDPLLIEDETALENVMLALAVRGAEIEESEAAARRALATLGIEGCAERPVDTLASSERRLVALARTLAGSAPVLVLDEPTAGLAYRERELALAALAAVRDQGATVLLATGDEETAQALAARGGRRVRLQEGRLHGGLPGITLLPRRSEEPGAPTPIARIELRRRSP
jgi:ABC-type ATPase involved in cell division